MQSIEYGLFARCESLTSIIIPNSVKSVSKYSFFDCESLKFVSVGKSVQEVNTQAFDCCPVEDVEFHCDEIKVGMFGDYHSTSHKNYKTIKHVTICYGVQKINDWAFRDWGNLETVQMSNTVKTIGRGAFWECKKLVSCNLSNSLTSMGEEAFCYCKSLQSISIPYGIKEIPYRAFEGCESMITVLIPNSVTTIIGAAFGGCISLTNLSIPSSVTSINNSFMDCSALETISVAADNPIYDSRNNCNCIIKTSNNELLLGCKNSVIPNTVRSIAGYSFYGISGLIQLSIPNSVTSIGPGAFGFCSDLTSITIPNSVTSISNMAFYNCGNLEEVTMSDSVKSIGRSAFEKCGKLKSFKIPNTLTSISEKTFAECESLTTIVIPQTISSIGEKAFWNCVSVDSIISLIELPFPILDNVFECGIEKRANLYNNPIYVPIGTKKLYEITDGWKQFTDIKEIAIDDNGTQYDDNSEVNDTTDLNGHVIGNIYYNISDENGEYSSAEGCIILRKPTTDEQMNEVVGMDLFGEDIKNNYTGIIFMVQAGSGTIKVNAETVGSMTLKVKIGNSAPVTMELEGKMKTSFPYTVTEPTYVYIYGGETASANARGMRKAEATENALKIYGIEWSESDTPTHVEAIRETSSSDTPTIYNLQGQRMQSTSRGINIVNGKKVFVK